MLAIAAAQLGYRCHIFAPPGDNVACEVAADSTIAAYDDLAALKAFAKKCDVVTFEFENVPVMPLKSIARDVPIYPPITALEVAQDAYVIERGRVVLGGAAKDVLASEEVRSAYLGTV